MTRARHISEPVLSRARHLCHLKFDKQRRRAALIPRLSAARFSATSDREISRFAAMALVVVRYFFRASTPHPPPCVRTGRPRNPRGFHAPENTTVTRNGWRLNDRLKIWVSVEITERSVRVTSAEVAFRQLSSRQIARCGNIFVPKLLSKYSLWAREKNGANVIPACRKRRLKGNEYGTLSCRYPAKFLTAIYRVRRDLRSSEGRTTLVKLKL